MNAPPIFALLLSLILCSGCTMTNAPKDDVAFDRAESIHSLVGCFANHAEGGSNTPQHFLTWVIWPKEKLDHKNIKAVRVVAIDANTLKVTAETDVDVLHETLFVQGRDFYLKAGRISVKDSLLASFAYPAGNVFIGVGHESKVLGIDKNGDGKLQEAATFAGTAFLVFPIAGQVQDSYRFRRDPKLCK